MDKLDYGSHLMQDLLMMALPYIVWKGICHYATTQTGRVICQEMGYPGALS